MPAPSSAEAFFDVVRKSGLIDPPALDRLTADVPPDTSATDLAGRLLKDGYITTFQANHLLKGRYKNFFIGKFKVLTPLGSGGMSQVYLCEHTTMKHRVALKLLPVKESKDPAAVTRFLREARAAAAVNHPNVVRAHDFDQSADGKFYYLIMDYVDGVNLHDLVKRIGPLPPEQAANYAAQAAVGLQAIYEAGLIHRDLKPSNLLLDRTGVIRILDLGLARFADDTADKLTRQFNNNAILGTADYLAPEQALQSDDLDIRADVYSLGATLYFLLAGTAPFEQLSVAQKLLAHQMREPAAVAGLPPGFAAVLTRMMAKKPDDRYQTPADLLDAVAPFAADPLPPPDDFYFPSIGLSTGPRTGPLSTATGPKTGTTSRVGLTRPAPTTRSLALGPTAAGTGSGVPLLADEPKPSRWKWAAVAAGGLAVVAGAVVALNPFGGGSKADPKKGDPPPVVAQQSHTPPTPDRGVPPPAGSLVVGSGGAFRTVADALKAAKPGGRIVLTDADHAEELTVSGGPAGVTVQGWPDDRPVTWTTPSDRPAAFLSNAAGLTLANVRFDGRGAAAVLVDVAGACPGLTLDRVTVANFKTAGVRLSGAAGDANRPITLSRLRAVGPGDSGVLFAGGPCAAVTVDMGRFETGLRAGVRAAVPVRDVKVTHGRFDGLAAGLAFAGDASAHAVAVTGCVFHASDAGLEFEAVPGPAPTVRVADNLFLRTRQTTRTPAADGKQLGLPNARWVWHDEGLPASKETSIPAGDRYFRKAFEIAGPPPADAVLDVGAVTSFEAWVNGQRVGGSDPKHFTKRVYAFPVGKLLATGTNVIAVHATHTLDPINSGFAVAAGLTVRLGKLAATDETWKSSPEPADGWQAAAFAADWKPVKAWALDSAYNLPWLGAVWDSQLPAVGPQAVPVPFTVSGNVRDYHSQDTFPLLNSVRGTIPGPAGTDPADDGTYLRTPRATPKLYTVGTDGGPVGVPMDR